MRQEKVRGPEDPPQSEQREFRDKKGRTWIGSVTVGRFEGGEDNAEVVFVCQDDPDLPSRFTQLGVPAREVDAFWRRAAERDVHETFDRSREA